MAQSRSRSVLAVELHWRTGITTPFSPNCPPHHALRRTDCGRGSSSPLSLSSSSSPLWSSSKWERERVLMRNSSNFLFYLPRRRREDKVVGLIEEDDDPDSRMAHQKLRTARRQEFLLNVSGLWSDWRTVLYIFSPLSLNLSITLPSLANFCTWLCFPFYPCRRSFEVSLSIQTALFAHPLEANSKPTQCHLTTIWLRKWVTSFQWWISTDSSVEANHWFTVWDKPVEATWSFRYWATGTPESTRCIVLRYVFLLCRYRVSIHAI